jgi:hypothetical protein
MVGDSLYGKANQFDDLNGNAVHVLALDTTVVIDGTQGSATTSVFIEPAVVRIASKGDLYLTMGENPTSSPETGALLRGDLVEFFKVEANDKIAVYGDFVAYITTMK